ncbi:PTS ascorbate transporter subunit IIC [Tuberibacillus sp. Marseille-P3662]|uniref:PTS ascorbate transporter subunit IIC n=1 Tax=Tuberibacillus sp. Marseille-P3662 TaxID=1965358 RepID=UPI001C385D41|nr:PTS ascorbate transporter subunit IIC [Tuberibacillus sp. Marseille-P3662]
MLHFIVNEVLSKPAFLVGLMALIGLLAQKKAFSDVISGTLKTIVGFLILTGGSDIIVAALKPLGTMVQEGFNLHGVVPTNEAIVAVAQDAFGAQTAIIMALGFIMNIILARITPAKFIFLTGHHLFFMATLFAVVLGSAGVASTNQAILGGILLGTVATMMPALVHPFMRKITNNAPFALGHFNSLGYIISSLTGKSIGNKEKTTEDIKISSKLEFLRDSTVMTTLTMIIMYVILAIAAGPNALKDFTDGSNYIMYAIVQAITFGAGLAVILMGVRMILAEIVPAFQGIAQKIVPNALPALDAPTTFTFAPTAVLVGFIASLIGGLISMAVMGPLGLVLIIPGMVPHFFDGGTAGVFGNATGGRRGAIIGSFINGILITVLPAMLLSFLGSFGLSNTTFGDSDFGWAGVLAGYMSKLGIGGTYVTVIIVCGLFIALASYVSIKDRKVQADHDEMSA